jgi:ferredoxin
MLRSDRSPSKTITDGSSVPAPNTATSGRDITVELRPARQSRLRIPGHQALREAVSLYSRQRGDVLLSLIDNHVADAALGLALTNRRPSNVVSPSSLEDRFALFDAELNAGRADPNPIHHDDCEVSSVSPFNLEIDPDQCMGAQRCVFLAPEVFDLDDEGTAVVLDTAGLSEERANLAISVTHGPR